MKKPTLFMLAFCALATPVLAEQDHQPYAGLQDRKVSSLSDKDIEDLSNGAGWGLALPAELNGYPGPRHILELAAQLELTPEQHAQVTSLFNTMEARAKEAGADFIAAEIALDQLFKNGVVEDQSLKTAIENAETARANLRFVHLSQHLKTIEILSAEQVTKYNVLRGYGSDDPCNAVPEGHDPNMWRRHNGCSD